MNMLTKVMEISRAPYGALDVWANGFDYLIAWGEDDIGINTIDRCPSLAFACYMHCNDKIEAVWNITFAYANLRRKVKLP